MRPIGCWYHVCRLQELSQANWGGLNLIAVVRLHGGEFFDTTTYRFVCPKSLGQLEVDCTSKNKDTPGVQKTVSGGGQGRHGVETLETRILEELWADPDGYITVVKSSEMLVIFFYVIFIFLAFTIFPFFCYCIDITSG